MNTFREHSTSGVPIPVCSRRDVARNADIPKTPVFRIRNGVLQVYSYKLQSHQQLWPDDAAERIACANEFCWNSKAIHNGCSVSSGQTSLIFHFMEQLIIKTVDSWKMATLMHTQRNP